MMRWLSESRARRVSPAMYLLAALCFLLPFASVSCNSDRARPLVETATRSLGGIGSRPTIDAGKLNACLDALKGTSVATYSGLTLVVGSDPSVPTTRVEACPASQTPAPAGGRDQNIGTQSFNAVALAMVILALIFGVVPFRGRGLVVAILSGIAMVLLVLSENRLQTLIPERAGTSLQRGFGGSSSALTSALQGISDFFTVSPGIGYWLALVILGVAALYNSAATIVSGGLPSIEPPPRRPAGEG